MWSEFTWYITLRLSENRQIMHQANKSNWNFLAWTCICYILINQVSPVACCMTNTFRIELCIGYDVGFGRIIYFWLKFFFLPWKRTARGLNRSSGLRVTRTRYLSFRTVGRSAAISIGLSISIVQYKYNFSITFIRRFYDLRISSNALWFSSFLSIYSVRFDELRSQASAA